jgi:trehalose 6-phosphate phosphatase
MNQNSTLARSALISNASRFARGAMNQDSTLARSALTGAILEAMSPVAGGDREGAVIATLRADPSRAAILTDVDGTLAPIVDRPEQAAVPEAARAALAALSERFGLVGCVSGRRALEARRLVGIDGITYAGNHGMELLLPGEEAPSLDPALQGRERDAVEFVAGLGDEGLAGLGLRVEDKGPIQALHWRGADDEPAAEARAREIAVAAEAAGLEPHWGRKVLELRPAGASGKDVAVAALLRTAGVATAVYGGDDRTDLDAFRRLRELRQEGELERAICVGVSSPEAPPELTAESDLRVDGPAGWLEILESLAD